MSNSRPLPRPRRRWLRWLLVAAGACVLMCGGTCAALPWLLRNSNIRVSLKIVRLAPLPASARNVEIEGSSSLFSSDYHIKFTAPSADINAWVAASPGLTTTPETLTAGHRYPTDPLPQAFRSAPPDWFKRVIDNGRRWKIPQDSQANYGEVIIDDTTSTVYVWSAHS